MTDFPLRGIGKSILVRSPLEIPLDGFGQREITRRVSGGGIITETAIRAYRLSCGCLVTRQEECGGICPDCRGELEELEDQLLGTHPHATPESLDWLATPCRICWRPSCHYNFCSHGGGCPRHITQAVDGHHYCQEHFIRLKEETELLEVRESNGIFVARGLGFWKSLFFDTRG